MACGKHFPGHGDTRADSHLELPIVEMDAAALEGHIIPFERAARAGIAALMSAHVVYPALARGPATLAREVCTALRDRIGFRGVLFSDDLEMKAISARHGVGEAAVAAVEAGCDALLVCSREDLQEEAHAALVGRAETVPSFRARCEEAAARVLAARRRAPPRPIDDADGLARVFAASRGVQELVDARRGPAA
jgi:beta-N-acetylhexosaminidase